MILMTKPIGDGPGGTAIVAVVLKNPTQGMGTAASIGSFPLPMAPPEQGMGPIHTALAPLETTPGGHSLQAIAVERKAPVLANSGMNIDQSPPQPSLLLL